MSEKMFQLPPYSAAFLGKFRGDSANYFNDIPFDAKAALGRVYGGFDVQCPKCGSVKETHLDWEFSSFGCECCNTRWYVRLLLYASNSTKILTPSDWIMPSAKKAISAPTDAAPAHPCGGAEC